MVVKKDNIHISFRYIDGFNKAFNFIISSREAGKSTEWILKSYKNFEEGGTNLIIRRQIVDITDAYILSIQTVLNKFIDESIEITYKKGSLKDGVVYLYIKDKLYACLIGLSCTIAKIKSLVLRDIRAIFFDEFIVNPKFKEKYLPDEATRFKEVYNTFYRESETKIKCYFLGNPYSHFNPYFLWLNVNTALLKEGVTLTGSNWIIWCYKLTDELKSYILERNPLYEFDDSYTRYGFNGEAICDENIKLSELPKNYSLQYMFKSEGKIIGVYKNRYINDGEDRYFCKFEDKIGDKRNAFCFEFDELINRCSLLSMDDRYKFARFKRAMQRNQVAFSSIAVYYLVVEIYTFL